MNDLPTHPRPSNCAENAPAPQGPWRKAAAFLNRDVKSFFSRGDGALNGPADEAVAPTALEQPVESLVDVNRLPELAFRREVLDWRDDFQAAVTKTMARLEAAFIERVDAELGNISLLRSVFARPAEEVLQRSFDRIVRWPLIATLRQEEAKLDGIARKWALLGTVDRSFNLRRLNAECEILHGIGFKPAHRNLIASRIQALLLEPAGIADDFHHQGMDLSRNLLQAKKSL